MQHLSPSLRLWLLTLGACLVAFAPISSARAQDSTPAPSAPTAPAAPAQPAPANPSVSPNIVTSGTTTAPPPPEHHDWRLRFGPDVGVYLPTDSKTRNRFGSSWFSIGIGLGSVRPASDRGQFGFDFTLVSKTGTDKHAYLAPLGVQYRVGLASSGSSIPYIGVSGDLVLADVRSPQDNAHSGLRATGGGSVFIGSTLGPSGFVEAKYLAVGSVQSFNLSGLNLTAGLRF